MTHINMEKVSHAVAKMILKQKEDMIEDLFGEDGRLAERLTEYERNANATAARQTNKINRHVEGLGKQLIDHIDTTLEELKKEFTHRVVIEKLDLPKVEIDSAHEMLQRAVRKSAQGIHTALVGPAGTGKGKGAQQVAQALGLDFYAKSCSIMDTKSDWLGFIDAGGTYHSTPFRDSYEHGGVMFIDEGDAANPQVFVQINAGLSDGRMAFPDGMIEQHEDFVVLMAANTWGRGADRQYRGRAIQDAASLNRFAKVFWDYDENLERKIAPHPEWCTYVQAVRKIVLDHNMHYVVSYRQTINGGKELLAGAPLDEVAHDHIFADWHKDDLEKLNVLMNGSQNGLLEMHKQAWKGVRL